MPEYDEKFKKYAVEYFKKHTEKTGKECAADLGIGYTTLARWYKEATGCKEIIRTEEEAARRKRKAESNAAMKAIVKSLNYCVKNNITLR